MNINTQKGFAPIVIVIISLIILSGVGVGGYFGYKAYKNNRLGNADELQKIDTDWSPMMLVDLSEGSGLAEGELVDLDLADAVRVDLPNFEVDLFEAESEPVVIPEIQVETPTVPSFGELSFDFSGLSSLFVRPEQPSGADGPPAGYEDMTEPPEYAEDQPEQQEPPAEDPVPQPPPQSEVNASNCAQFSTMPSAQYCSSVGDPNGRTLCEQCKTAGF